MRKSLVVVLGCCLLLSGCSSGLNTVKGCCQEMIKITSELNDILASVKDKASADAARTQLQKLSARMKTLGEQMAKLPQPTEDEKAWMEKEFKPAMEANSKKMMQTMSAVQDPEVKKMVGEIMMEFATAAMKSGPKLK